MSFASNKKYAAPRVEDSPSEVGDSPAKAVRPTSRMRKPPTSAPDVRTDANRSASDSGYSSRTDRSARSSAADSAIAGIYGEDVAQGRTRATPYQNTHQPRKESVDKIRKPRPKSMAVPSTRADTGSMPPPPLPPYLPAPTSAGAQVRPTMPHRNHTIQTPQGMLSSSPVQSSIPQFHQPPLPSPFLTGPPAYYPSYTTSAPQSAGYDAQRPNFSQPQPGSGGYQPAQPMYPTPSSTSYHAATFSVHPPTPSPGFAVPAQPQRPAPSHRQTAPVPQHRLSSSYSSFQPDPSQLELDSLALSAPRQKLPPPDFEPFVDPIDKKIKCWRKGVLHVHNGSIEHVRRKLKAKKDRRREREVYTDSESSGSSSSSYCSTCESDSESESATENEKGRMSPRKALHRTQSSRSGPQSPRKASRPTSFASSRNSDEHHLAWQEKQKLSDMEEYQKQTSTSRRQSTALPPFVEDTARATRTAASQRPSGSPSPSLQRSPARSRTSESRRDDRRDSLINISAKDSLSFKPGEDGMLTFNAPGQQILMTINNNGQMMEKRYPSTGSSQSGQRVNRRASNASTTRSRASVDLRRAGREQYD